MALTTVSERDFLEEVLQCQLPVLVEFGATWCGPCKVVEPELEALAAELQGKAKVVKVDIDQSRRLATELGVQSVPTFVVFAQGQPVAGKDGTLKQAQLRELITPHLLRDVGAIKPAEVAALHQADELQLVDTRGRGRLCSEPYCGSHRRSPRGRSDALHRTDDRPASARSLLPRRN